MNYIKPLLYWILDNALAWFTPQWRRSGREAIAALKRYVNFHRHTLSEDTIRSCTEREQEISAALLTWNKE